MTTRLQFETEWRDGKTILANCFVTPPLKLANITEDKQAGHLELMMMSSSPGILDGDDQGISVKIGDNCTVRTSTQSFQRLFTMQKSATQTINIEVGNHATLTWCPHPVVPHVGTSFTGVNHLYLTNTSKLIWSEIITCGRKQNGELFQFNKLHLSTKIFQEGNLVLFENMFVVPATTHLLLFGLWEGFTHQATFIVVARTISPGKIQQILQSILTIQQDIMFGISTTQSGAVLVRILGNKAEQLFSIAQQMAAETRPILAGDVIK